MNDILLNIKIEGFDWDDSNREKIRLTHNVEPCECEEVFLNQAYIIYDSQHSQNEERWKATGITNKGRKLFIIFTLRKNKVRVISARDQNRKERSEDE